MRLHLFILLMASSITGQSFAAAKGQDHTVQKKNNVVLTGLYMGWKFDIRVPYRPDITIAELKEKVDQLQIDNRLSDTSRIESIYLVQSKRIHRHVYKKIALENNAFTLKDYDVKAGAKIEVFIRR